MPRRKQNPHNNENSASITRSCREAITPKFLCIFNVPSTSHNLPLLENTVNQLIKEYPKIKKMSRILYTVWSHAFETSTGIPVSNWCKYSLLVTSRITRWWVRASLWVSRWISSLRRWWVSVWLPICLLGWISSRRWNRLINARHLLDWRHCHHWWWPKLAISLIQFNLMLCLKSHTEVLIIKCNGKLKEVNKIRM